MKILLLTLLILSIMIFVGKKIIIFISKNLFKGQEMWSGKKMKIKHNKTTDSFNSENSQNYLELIADESDLFLDEESKNED